MFHEEIKIIAPIQSLNIMAKQNIHFKIFYFDIVELSKKMYQKTKN